MNEPASPSRPLRSIAAVVLGLLVTAALSIGADLLLRAAGLFPPADQPLSNAQFALAAGYRTVFAVVGGYVAARFAPRRPLRHALILGGIGLLLALLGLIASRGRGPEFGPAWYPLSLVLTALPATWAGATLQARRRRG
jgi:MFS-type transporter involved in bile tolerance (Atg22 family)